MSSPDPGRDLVGRTVVVTGGTSGIGRAAARALAARGAQLSIVGRNLSRLQEVADELTRSSDTAPGIFQADFAELDQVRELAVKLRSRHARLDVLASNAGALFSSRRTTSDGFEATIQVNHLAGFLLVHLLRDRLSGGRLIFTSSDSYTDGRLAPDDLNGDQYRYSGGRAYGASKQANIMTAAEAARRYPDILSASYHPGQIRTRFGRGTVAASYFRYNPFLRSADKGADMLVWLATVPAWELTSGAYYKDRSPHAPEGPTGDPELASRVWESSAAAVGVPPT